MACARFMARLKATDPARYRAYRDRLNARLAVTRKKLTPAQIDERRRRDRDSYLARKIAGTLRSRKSQKCTA